MACTVRGGAAPPNVVFIAVDDMNNWVGHLGATPHAITPNIDRLAARGVSFTNAHTAGVYCAPSRASIFTGQYASTTGCYETQIYFANHPDLRPLQVSFHEAGYETFGAGKLFHHPAGYLDLRGWTEFFVRNPEQRRTGWPLDSWAADTPMPDPLPHSVYNRGKKWTPAAFLDWGAVPNDQEAALADTRRADWVASKLAEPRDKPFFLAVGFYAPHYPNYCPQKYFDLYKTDEIQLPPYKDDDRDDLPDDIRKKMTNRAKIHERLEELGAVKDAIHGYLACMSYADAMVGRVLDALDRSPYRDNTIVVLWSDHGYHHGEKGQWGKHTLWERTSHVPFVWAGPKIARGARPDASVSLIDIYPTLVDLCALPKPGQKLEVQSIASILRDPATAKDRSVYLPYMEPGAYAVINRDWRYIRYADGGEELYNVRDDPNEWYNLAVKGGHEAIIAELRKSAPTTFAEPGPILNKKKNLVIEGETFHWKTNP
ncbi:MAG: sulfatase-like hydrolase/transferase [Phycisphaera sp.]|nr:sulfatase-like hydrolase/transferase [Phycisphaera sp.]